MRANRGLLVKGVLLICGLGLGAVFLQFAMDQARQTSCNASSDKTKCLAPSVADFALTSDGPERIIKLKDESPKKPE
jgi:hypothetical protein